jgi:hypothetical protein
MPHTRVERVLTVFTTFALVTLGQTSPAWAAGNDPDAGSWQMIVLTGPTQFQVPIPAQTSS